MDKEDNKNRDYLFVDETKKVKKVNLAKGLAIAAGGGAALGGATFGISKLVKSSGNEKKDEPSPEINPESDKPTDSEEEEKEPEKKEEKNPSEKPKYKEKGGFVEWCKNNPLISFLVIFIVGINTFLITLFVFYAIFVLICAGVKKRNNYAYISKLDSEEKMHDQPPIEL